MKFTVSSSQLLKQLMGLSGVISPSNALPILDCFLFQINKNELKLCASDLETTITTSIEIKSEDTFEVAIPSQLLLDTLKTFAETPLVFNVEMGKKAIEIQSDYGKYKLIGHDAKDFPRPAQIESPSSFEMEESVLSKAINKTLFAVGDDELRPAMCGVYIKLDENGLTFVSTDTHKFAKYKRGETKAKKVSSYIIPRKPLSLLKNILTTGKVKLQYNNSNVLFEIDKTSIICRLIDAKYPNYEAVIPKNNPNILTIGREIFLNSIRRVSVFSNKRENTISLSFKGQELTIAAEDIDYANEATETLKCNYKGADMSIGFSAKLLIDILSQIETDEVEFALGAPNIGGVMKPIGSKVQDEDVMMIAMPQLLQA